MADPEWLERMRKSFDELDVDKDGTISETEMARLGEIENDKLSQEELKNIMTMLDVNEDGKIDFEEFKRITEEYFNAPED